MISRYFDSSIHILIDEMNMILINQSRDKQIDYARYKFSEADFAIRLGSPFRQLARYPMQGTQGQDIIVDYKDFEVEIKYWRNWLGGTGIQKLVWEEAYEKAFHWLIEEIKIGKKNNRAMICGWFTFFEWRELLQLGSTTGGNPAVNSERIKILPFLNCEDGRIGTIRTNYSIKHGEAKYGDCKVNWELHGANSDMLNVVLLY
ncbi:MAG TPA: hypothetical protein VJ205_04935 [Gammaproteobacteria bacterium]|nr:hypothetical protein [Gammaproteobacteria bacterium]